MDSYADFGGNYAVPPVRNSGWEEITKPLLSLIEENDRTIVEIVNWGREQSHTGSLVRHMLAWLSFTDLVYYVVPERMWRIGAEPASAVERVKSTVIQDDATQDDNL